MNRRLALLGFPIGYLAISSAVLAQQSIPIKVQVEPSTGSKLQVRLTNASSTGIRLYSSDLPWATRGSMIVAAVKLTGAGETLADALAIYDPPPGEVTIAAGQTMTGEIDLAMRFQQSWKKALGKPLLVFWSYQLQSVDGRASNRINGSLEFTPR